MPKVYQPGPISVAAAQLTGWSGSRAGTTLRLTGPCPACDDPQWLTVSLSSTTLEGAGDAEPARRRTFPVICNCETDHPGWPGTPPKGCGAMWDATAVIGPGDVISLEPASSTAPGAAALSAAAQAFRNAQDGQLDRLRAAAEKWVAALGALFGLLGIAGLALGADQVRKLAQPGKSILGVAVAVAIIAAGAAIIQAYRSAYGWPRTRSVATDAELLAWHEAQQSMPATTATRLRSAVALAGGALLLLAVAGGLNWFLPEAAAEQPLVKVVTVDQAQICGTLLNSSVDGELRIRRSDDGAVEKLPAAGVARLTAVTKC
jgi:hypothetical protein